MSITLKYDLLFVYFRYRGNKPLFLRMSNIEKSIEKAEKFYANRKFSDAIYWYTRAIAIAPNAELYSERAVAYFHNSQLKESLEDMDRAQELEPEKAYRYASRAYIKDAIGDTEGAVRDYEKAIELDPEDAIAHNNLGLLIEKLGHTKKAKVFFDFADAIDKQERDSKSTSPSQPRNIQSDLNKKRSKTSLSGEMAKVFTDKKQFKEFLKFVSGSFKTKE